ncbi:MAG: hypothetical protein VX355_00435 [Chloroflexota bacterium]|jgi:tRNA nucleotidyltransferase (CCA-adding enzyme)|tara:strand:+ start:12211 stop:13521 length:1311 start_codon:yes stop_codon:yes gene_type:complete
MKIVSSEMKNVLPTAHLKILNAAVDLSQQMDTDLYLVGGCVRDIMLGLNESEFDIDLTGSSIDRGFATTLADKLNGAVTSSSVFGTHKLSVPVGLGNNLEIDLARCRSETYKNPGALPEVDSGDIFQDLDRRDFSIAAMCIVLRSPKNQGWQYGQLIDPHCGYDDLINKQLRVLHKNSFIDDPTRMFRLIRYSCRLGFDIEESTRKTFESSVNWVTNISGDRVRHELEKIFEEKEVGLILYTCVKLGLLPAFFTELSCDHLKEFRDMLYSDSLDQDRVEFWLGLFAINADKTQLEYLSQTLNLSSKQNNVINDLCALNEQLKQNEESLVADNLKRSVIYKFLLGYNLTAIRVCAATTSNKSIKTLLEIYLNSLINTNLYLSGEDLISLGMSKGPEIGELLNDLLYAKLDGQLESADQEIQFVKDHIFNLKDGINLD